MSYDVPITITQQVANSLAKRVDDEIYRSVLSVGIEVDRDELLKVKNDKDCVFCEHCTDIFWDYTSLIYMIFCSKGHDPWDRPCKFFSEDQSQDSEMKNTGP